mgnify:CR=1 FL=1|jgi:crossover junction endodeoxyribonuclease RusA
MHYELYLPFPPSVNHYYVKTKRGVFISKKGREFRAEVIQCIHDQVGLVGTITDRILVEIVLYPPDRRARDVDNYNKPLLDAITHAMLWEDDSIIDQLFNYRGEVVPRSGSVFLRIQDAGPIIPVTSPSSYL